MSAFRQKGFIAEALKEDNTIKELQCAPLTVPIPTKQRIYQTQDPLVVNPTNRYYFSSAGKTNAHQFNVSFYDKLTQVKEFRFLSASVQYTNPTVAPQQLFIRLKNFPSSTYNASAHTVDGLEYHATLPLPFNSTPGTIVKTSALFAYRYRTVFERRSNVKDIKCEVYYENPTTGIFELFTDLTYINLEMEFSG